MNITVFIKDIASEPLSLLFFLLTLGVIFVNGWTDAPNAISSCVSTRAISPKNAVLMSALFNFLGMWVMTYINSEVAFTIKNMVNISGNRSASLAMCAGMASVIMWSTMAWYFAIPTSESHALISGISGSAIALTGGLAGISLSEWSKILIGLVSSSLSGLVIGLFLSKLTCFLLNNTDRKKTSLFLDKAQIFGGMAMSFMHGAQDGQKFMGVIMLGISLSEKTHSRNAPETLLYILVICSVTMALGTSVGGYRIIKAVSSGVIKQEKHLGFSADLAASFCLFLSSVFGLPVSTTHVKTTAVVGSGLSTGIRQVNYSKLREMLSAWLLTFPACLIIGFFMAKLFIALFG